MAQVRELFLCPLMGTCRREPSTRVTVYARRARPDRHQRAVSSVPVSPRPAPSPGVEGLRIHSGPPLEPRDGVHGGGPHWHRTREGRWGQAGSTGAKQVPVTVNPGWSVVGPSWGLLGVGGKGSMKSLCRSHGTCCWRG